MSEKKPPAGKPTGPTPPGGSFEQEFEKFLRDEATQVGAVYRKLPQAEPDAQLDARVRALAHGALREDASPSSTQSAQRVAPARAARRWVPAFASAAVLVLAAGIAWRMGPQNWAQKDAARSVAVDAAASSNAPPAVTKTDSPTQSLPMPATQAQAADSHNDEAARAAKARAQSATSVPVPFPAKKAPPPRLAAPAPSGGASSATAPSELRKAEDAQHAEARVPDSRMATPAPAGQSAPAAEKSAAASTGAASAETQQSATNATPAPPASEIARSGASAAATYDGAARIAAPAEPSKPVPTQRRSDAQKTTGMVAPPPPPSPVIAEEAPPAQAVAAPAPLEPKSATQETKTMLAPPPPPPPQLHVIGEESTPAQTAKRPVPQHAPADTVRRDEAQEKTTRQHESALADNATLSAAAKARAPAAQPASPPPPAASPPPPPPAAAFVPEPSAATAPAPKPLASDRADRTEAQKQSHLDRFTTPDGLAQATVPIRPTAAQVAAWPAPNCRASGTMTPSGTGVEARTWNYPPDVPGSVHLRIVIVESWLNTASREGARKAYTDFRLCYPDDKWPEPLLRQLGTR